MQLRRSTITKAPEIRVGMGRGWARYWLLLWEEPALAALMALGCYAALARAWGSPWHTSQFAYYNYLADALLHGQINLRVLPPTTADLSLFHGRYYLYWPPLPAILLMPFVALFGVRFSDVAFTIALGAANVGVVARLLRLAGRHGVAALNPTRRALLVLFFALGTVHVTLAPHGRVWFTGQLIGFLCVALGYMAALGRRGYAAFALAGLAFAGALLTRNHLALAGAWPAWYLLRRDWPLGWRKLLARALAGLTPVLLAVALLAIYNWLRFGSPSDNGLAYHQMNPFFASDYRRYGVFSPHYLPINLYYQYIAYPLPLSEETWQGGSLFLLSPVFFAGLLGLAAERRSWSAWLLLASILLTSIPILLLMGTGWVQFGPRYTLDFTVPLLLLTALGARRWPTWYLALLTAVSIVTYLIGTLAFGYQYARI